MRAAGTGMLWRCNREAVLEAMRQDYGSTFHEQVPEPDDEKDADYSAASEDSSFLRSSARNLVTSLNFGTFLGLMSISVS